RRVCLGLLAAWSLQLPADAQRDPEGGQPLLRGRHTLEVVEISAPGWVKYDHPFDVAVTAADDRGIGFLEVAFHDQTFRIPGNGERTLNAVVTFTPRSTRSIGDAIPSTRE